MASSKKLTPSKSDKEQSQRYKVEERWKKNREAKLERHLSKFPNDKQAEQALSRETKYRRKTPYKKVWSSSGKDMARTFKKAGAATSTLFRE